MQQKIINKDNNWDKNYKDIVKMQNLYFNKNLIILKQI